MAAVRHLGSGSLGVQRILDNRAPARGGGFRSSGCGTGGLRAPAGRGARSRSASVPRGRRIHATRMPMTVQIPVSDAHRRLPVLRRNFSGSRKTSVLGLHFVLATGDLNLVGERSEAELMHGLAQHAAIGPERSACPATTMWATIRFAGAAASPHPSSGALQQLAGPPPGSAICPAGAWSGRRVRGLSSRVCPTTAQVTGSSEVVTARGGHEHADGRRRNG
jgi:hypothetical protein